MGDRYRDRPLLIYSWHKSGTWYNQTYEKRTYMLALSVVLIMQYRAFNRQKPTQFHPLRNDGFHELSAIWGFSQSQ